MAMQLLSERIRKATTFLLASFLWIHAVLFLNFQSTLIANCTRVLRLSTSEFVLFALLVTFSFLTGSGFWKTLLSRLYIYFFPFVVLGYALYLCFLLLRRMNRWFKSQASPQLAAPLVANQGATSAIVPVLSASPESRISSKEGALRLLRFLLRPFQRFMLLWCVLLLVTTHIGIVWLCLIVVLANLARKIFLLLTILLFSDPWLKKAGTALTGGLQNALAALAAITLDSAPDNELQNLWNQLSLWRKILEFLKDPYLMSRWAWVLGILFFGSIYIYIAILFSFGYYGVARASGIQYSWPDALLTSVFIPFFISDLPKVFAERFLGGIQCLLVVVVGVGTIVNFLRRKLDTVRRAATTLSDRFYDQNVREKYVVLEARFSPTSKPSSNEGSSPK